MSLICFLTKLKQNKQGQPRREAYEYYLLAKIEGKPLWSYYFPALKHTITQNTVSRAVAVAAIEEENEINEKRERERNQKKTYGPQYENPLVRRALGHVPR